MEGVKCQLRVLKMFADSVQLTIKMLNSSCSVIVRVSVVLKRTVGDSD